VQAACVAAGGESELYALDIHEFKAQVLTRRMAELHVPGVVAVVGDATDVAAATGLPPLGSADAVLLDAPCSGLGSLRRRPEKRWRVSLEDIDRLAVLQGRMLEQSALLVRVGGRVVYSTCTVSRRENHDVVTEFVRESGGEFVTAQLAGTAVEEFAGGVTEEGWFQSVPSSGGPDGHFVAVLERIR
jgi:16S rRNA (cytosine967-C5)-methyltransferase